MSLHLPQARFWDRVAAKYAKSPVKNIPAYEATLSRVQSYLQPGDKVLEFGCGTGSTALRLAADVAQYTASDISGAMIEIARQKAADVGVGNVEFTVAPVVETRFAPGSFDAVLGFNILHLLRDVPTAVARAHALLKPGGLFITKTGCLGQMNPLLRLVLPVMQFFGKAPFVGVFKAPGLEKTITDGGFEILEACSFAGAPESWFVVARKT